MRVVENLPAAFERFQQIGGVLHFVVFEDAHGGDAELLAAMAGAVPGWCAKASDTLSNREIDRLAFFGEWYDAETGSLLKIGEYTSSERKVLVNPKLRDLRGIQLVSGGWPIPEAGTGGQFAYAFSCTPYGLWANPEEVQELFDEITEFILPAKLDHKILDWSRGSLSEVSPYFAAGMEWWGVFLFTIHVPEIQRLTVIAGSTTD
jgi:hypothetical protein